MEDTAHDQNPDQPTPADDLPATESKINRREMAKLLGAVTALSASLGVTLTSAQVRDGAQLQLQFLKIPADGNKAKAELLCTIAVSPDDQRKIASAGAPVELRVVGVAVQKDNGSRQAAQNVTVSSQTIPQAAWQTIKMNYDLKRQND